MRWRRYGGCKVTSSAALSGSTLYIGDYCGRLLALNARNGATRWSRSVNGRVYGTPAVAAGRVFVPSSTGGSLTAFSTSGRYLWRRNTGSYVYSSPAVAQGRVFFGSYNGVFYGLSARAGRDALVARHRRPDLGRRDGGRRRRVRRLVRASHPRRRCAQRACGAELPTVSTCRSRAPASDCSCTATRACSAGGAVKRAAPRSSCPAARRRRRWRTTCTSSSVADVGGSSTVEFVTTQEVLPARAKEPGVVADLRARSATAAVRQRGHARAAVQACLTTCAQPRRVPARRRVRAPLLHQQRRRAVRGRREERAQGLEVRLASVQRFLARRRGPRRLRDVHERAALQPQAERQADR